MVQLARGQRICTHVRLVKPAPVDAGSRLFGDVWMAVDDETEAHLWLTTIDTAFLPSIFEVSEFMAKANGLARMRHPDLVRVALVDREETYCVIGYEALDRASLFSDLLLQEKLDAEKVMRRAMAVAKGLAYLHDKGVLHGVLSPATTFEWEGSTVAWQYGLVQAVDSGALATACRRASDEELFAPEMHRGVVSPATDVWAWGRLVAEMASGLSALEAVNETLDGGDGFAADPRLIELMQQCLSADPGARIPDAGMIVQRLEAILRGGAVVGMPGNLAPPPPPKAHTGTLPLLEAGLPDDSGAFMELEDFDVVETGGHPVRRRSAGDSAAALKALAREELGESLAHNVDKILESDVNLGDSEPHLLELAQEVAKKTRFGAPSLDVGLRGSERQQPTESASGGAGDRIEIDEAARKQAFEIPRRPGPHGPSPKLMATALVLASAATLGLSGAHVLAARGGLDALLPASTPGPDAAASSPAPAGPTGVESGGASETSAEPTLVGPAAPPPPPKECAAGMVAVSESLCMDAGEYPGLKRIPQVSVTFRQAGTLCEQRGARLCSLEEWGAACGGAKRRRFPYGGNALAERCNTASVAGFPHEMGASGSYRDCVTPQGIFDLVGNVGEWTSNGVAVGGDSSTQIQEATCTAKGRPPKGYSGPDLGFRCCMDRGVDGL